MREIWKSDCDWDERIPRSLADRWWQWLEVLRGLKYLKIPRWCGLSGETRELHIFVDASERAMSAVAYVRGVGDEQGKVAFVAAKCKLDPASQKSIPRLELQAAVMGIRLAELILEVSTVPIVKVTYWTDSNNTKF